jgi:1,4-dihydroxy-2-naphthoate polyprenyltransferase
MGDVFVFIFFGLVSVLGSYFLITQQLRWSMLLPATTIGLLSAAVLNLNNMRDRLADAQVNKNTLAVKLGAKHVKLYHAFLLLTALVSAIIYFLIIGQKGWEWLPFIAFLPIINNLKVVFQNENPVLLDPELKKIALSTFLFALLFFTSNFF